MKTYIFGIIFNITVEKDESTQDRQYFYAYLFFNNGIYTHHSLCLLGYQVRFGPAHWLVCQSKRRPAASTELWSAELQAVHPRGHTGATAVCSEPERQGCIECTGAIRDEGCYQKSQGYLYLLHAYECRNTLHTVGAVHIPHQKHGCADHHPWFVT